MQRIFFVAPKYDGDGDETSFAEGAFYDEGEFAESGIPGPIFTTKEPAEKLVTDGKTQKVVSIELVGAKADARQVFEVTGQAEDGGATFGLFGTRAAAVTFAAKKKSEFAGEGGDDEGEGDECATYIRVRAHKVVAR